MTAADTKATPERKAKFLVALAKCGNVTEAAEIAGAGRVTVYRWRGKDEDFAEAWDGALEVATDALEAEARSRALEGTEEPVFYQGRHVANVRKKSDMLLMFLLNGYRPERFKRRSEVTGKDGGPLEVRASMIMYPVNERDEPGDDGK
jgi:hypothetical protein